MLKLSPNQSNTIFLSLFENSTDAKNNYYLLVLTNLQTRENEAKVVTKWAVNERVVELSFNLNTGSEPKFTTQDVSFYKYGVYEQTSSTNTNIEDASVLGLRETGKAWVGGTSEVSYIKQAEANRTNDVYLKV
jgi:hypothetical protein